MMQWLCALVLTAGAQPSVEFVRGDDAVEVRMGGRSIGRYIHGADLVKPALVAVKTRGGAEVTRRYPLTELEGGTDDHLHHVGMFFAVDQVNGTNFWNYYRNPGGDEPRIRHVSVARAADVTGRGTLQTVSHWIDKTGTFLLEEDRTMVFLAGDRKDEYAIDVTIELAAQDERVVFEDIEEGVFAIRVSDYLRESDPTLEYVEGKPLPAESVKGTGRYFTSNGDTSAEQAWGKRARWVALQGVRGRGVVGVAILNHPASVNYPCYWHVRNYGLFSANPLGQGDFQRQWPKAYRKNKVIPLRLTLEPGERAHFRFLVVVYEGIRTSSDIEQRWRQFAE